MGFHRFGFGLNSPIPLHLSLKEIWRNKGRYLLISLVVALITTLVLFISGLTEGLAKGNRELIEKIDANLLAFQANTDLSLQASRIPWSKLKEIQRVEGVSNIGPVGVSNVSLAIAGAEEPLKVNLVGVEPGTPGEPAIINGTGLKGKNSKDVIIDSNVAQRTGLQPGSTLTIKSLVGADEKLYDLSVVGITDSRQYFVQPAIFVPIQTWDEIKPKSIEEANSGGSELIFNVVAIQIDSPEDWPQTATTIMQQVSNLDVVDRQTAYEATPGYKQQQDTLNTQRIFTLLIGALVIGGFFQIQTLQKIAQVGMLKAIGASNIMVIFTASMQIIMINVFGVCIGAVGTYILIQNFPSTIPLSFQGDVVVGALISLLLIGPLSGLISIRTLLKAEPLTALGLGA